MGGAESSGGRGGDPFGDYLCGSKGACCNWSGSKNEIAHNKPQPYPNSAEPHDLPGGPDDRAVCDAGDGHAEFEEAYEDGTTYKGQLHCGKRHGVGKWASDTEAYEGQWKEDCRDGSGKQTWSDGRCYVGQFKGGQLHGSGRMEWRLSKGNMVYEGQYKEDLKDGTGRYMWADGRVYDGEWKAGKRDGTATVTNSKGQTKQEIWKDDQMVRRLDG